MVHQVRQRMGRQLAREAPVEADVVIGVPDSATPAAIGFSLESRHSLLRGADQEPLHRPHLHPARRRSAPARACHLKYNALLANLQGKRVVLVDDSIVRGNTAGPLVQLVRDGGAREVHVRVSSPPVRHPCFMGIDMATYSELIAHNLDIEAIQARIGADSLAYLSLAGMDAAVNVGLEQQGAGALQRLLLRTVSDRGAGMALCRGPREADLRGDNRELAQWTWRRAGREGTAYEKKEHSGGRRRRTGACAGLDAGALAAAGVIYAAPGNGGTAALATNVPIAAEDSAGLVAFALEKGIDLTVVGPEAPLAAGLVDALQAAGLRAFGPTRAAAQLEASKAFAKDFMQAQGIPTAPVRHLQPS